jgi:tight adherence protein C
MMWLVALAYVAAGTAAVCGLSLRQDPRVVGRLFPTGSDKGRAPGGMRAFLGRNLPLSRAREKVWDLVRATGSPESEVDGILGTKVLYAFAGVAAAATLWSSGGVSSFLLSSVLGGAGFAVPNFMLGRRVARIRADSASSAPDLLDAVAVCVTAGLSPRTSLDRAAAVVSGPLAHELEDARRQVTLGTPWRVALRGVSERTGLPELKRLSITLDRSERLGSPVADQLRRLARDVRDERRLRAEERARRAPVAMLFPLVVCILPAFVLAAVVPAMLVAARDIG